MAGTTNKNTKKAVSSSTKKRTQSATYSQKRKSEARKALEEEKNSNRKEIYLFIYLAVAIFLFLSNFGWCGKVGDLISKIMFGLTGCIAYILPIYIFFSAAFLLVNGLKKKVLKKIICMGLFLIVIAFAIQWHSGNVDIDMVKFWKQGVDRKGSGLIFGSLFAIANDMFGKPSIFIFMMLITIIAFIFVFDTSVIKLFKDKLGSIHFEDDEDEEDYEYEYEAEQTRKPGSFYFAPDKKVLDEEKAASKAEKKTPGNKKSEKKNEKTGAAAAVSMKPSFLEDILIKKDEPVPQDFFNKEQEAPDLQKTENEPDIMVDEPKAEEKPEQKRKRKHTRESYEEMLEALDEISNLESVAAVEAKPEPKDKKEDSGDKASDENKTETTIKLNSDKPEEKLVPKDSSVDASTYKFPSLDLLKAGKKKAGTGGDNEVRATAMKLKSTLENFGVNVTVTDYSCGPSVTRYELQPEQGVKVSKIVGLADDIKLNLAAADIRIEAPIPGKAAIGIEVPNKESSPVYFRELLESETFKKFPSNIAFAVGKDISGKVIVADIAKMPHLLIAGATGSGKSVCINTLIMSILYKANPNDVKLIMVDPKQVELSVYNGIPHMLIPVVTDPKKAAGALNWAVIEMTNRYQLFAQYNVRNLQGYNDKVKAVTGHEEGNEELKKLPQIVIIVDELADLMMVAHGEVEDAIVRLSQLARAAGIHLVIATQRPSVDVITGLIKANVPSRIAMTVSSGVDSRTILDMVGAEKLLGKGDMLFYPTGYPKPVRVQGAFLSDDEISDVVDFIKKQFEEVTYDNNITDAVNNSAASVGGGAVSGDASFDEYFVDAGRFIIVKEKASIGMLQRVYKIGFNRAARIMDQLSEVGVVGPEEGTKPRKILMSMEEFENYVEQNL